jgi:hypothetical protein
MSSIYSTFIPTFLYIKQHKDTGKLYFGKTTKNPTKYRGSGVHWKSHIKKHGNHIETLWFCLYMDEESITQAALDFSKLWNIVDSEKWLNLIEEDGIGNGLPVGHKKTEEHKRKISESNKGKPSWSTGLKLSEEFGHKVSQSKLSRNKKYTDQEKMNISAGTKKAMSDNIVKAKCSAPHIKNWILTDPSGQKHHISNLRQFCMNNNLHKSNLVQVAKGKLKSSKGWTCVYDITHQ